MLHDDYDERIDRFTRGIVRRKVRQLIGRAGFMRQDFGDLENDFYLRVLQALRSFDPSRAHRNAFITAVVERYAANLLRNKLAAKRDHRRIGSLNVTINIGDDETTEMAQAISQRELDARRGCHPRNDEELAQLVQDMREVLARLPDDLRELAERRKAQSLSDIAPDMGIPRTTLNEQMRRVRQRSEKTGLKDYL